MHRTYARSTESMPFYRMSRFLGIHRSHNVFYRKRKFLEGAEHIHTCCFVEKYNLRIHIYMYILQVQGLIVITSQKLSRLHSTKASIDCVTTFLLMTTTTWKKMRNLVCVSPVMIQMSVWSIHQMFQSAFSMMTVSVQCVVGSDLSSL